MDAGEGALEARRVVGIAGHDLRTGCGQGTRLVGVGLARDRTHGKPALGIGEDGAHQPSALHAGRADDGDGLLVGHVSISFSNHRRRRGDG